MTNSLSIQPGGHTNPMPDPGILLAAVPGLLGFVPEQSVVLVAFRDRRTVLATMRHDLFLTKSGFPSAGMRELFGTLGTLAESYDAAGTVAVIIDDRYPPTDKRYRKVAEVAEKSFRKAGGLSAVFAMNKAALGAEWHTIWRPPTEAACVLPFEGELPDTGTLSDPNASPTALERAVNTGRRILSSRSEIAALLEPEPHCADEECRAQSPQPTRHVPGRSDARGLAFTLATISRFDGGDTHLSCEDLNGLAEALVSIHVRDALLGLSLTGLRGTCEDFWRTLTKRLPAPARAAAATLLGYLHYMAGEGAYAGIAFQTAHDADPEYNLANLLDTALFNGMRPKELSGLAELAYDIAERLGAELPPPVFAAAG
ncbi:DUF4192 domain-containing protein [Gordonia sp. (in: high G+C Gram-positive bacteria)]|uniref:DUF4192 domain-containing protein n=1 Tax=Gordonia sp. (in: high G+C Gram-positive bacteria) TaxID=84139 RepID=UPI003C773870